MRQPLIFLSQMIYHYIQTRRFRWIVFTLFCGSLPILLRLLLAESLAEHTEPLILLSDVVFLGLMFNASAMANITAEKIMPTVFLGVFAAALGFSVCLATVYTSSMFQETTSYSTWLTVCGLILCSLFLAFFTTSTDAMETIQASFDLSDQVPTLPSESRQLINKLFTKAIDERDTETIRKLGYAIRLYKQMIVFEGLDE